MQKTNPLNATRMTSWMVGMSATALMLLMMAAVAFAGPGDRRGGGPCAAEVERLCPDAEGRAERRQCLMDNKAQLSDACLERIDKRKEARAAVRAACAEDAKSFCPGLGKGKELRQCMREHREQLSDSCVEAIKTHRPNRASEAR